MWNMPPNKSLGAALPEEQARARDLLVRYKSIGAAGAFGALVIEAALRRADAAAISGDLVAMLHAYQELKGLE